MGVDKVTGAAVAFGGFVKLGGHGLGLGRVVTNSATWSVRRRFRAVLVVALGLPLMVLLRDFSRIWVKARCFFGRPLGLPLCPGCHVVWFRAIVRPCFTGRK